MATDIYGKSERESMGMLFDEFFKKKFNNYAKIEQDALMCYNTCKKRDPCKDMTAKNFGQAFYSGVRCKLDHKHSELGFAFAHLADRPKGKHLEKIKHFGFDKILLIAEPFLDEIEQVIFEIRNSKYFDSNSFQKSYTVEFDATACASGADYF
jgi:hypothetical protein